jgi:EthD domain
VLKLFEPWTRRLDMTHEQAVRHWLDVHVPLVKDTLGERTLRYVANVGLESSFGTSQPQAPPYDGIAEHWLDVETPEEVVELLRANAPALAPDSRRFIGLGAPMVMEQVVQVERERGHRGVKMMFLLTRRPELTREQSDEYWLERHAPLVRDSLGDALVRYATNIALPAAFGDWPDRAAPYDGIAELWFDCTPEAWFELVGKLASVLLPDERAFLGTYQLFVADERLQKGDVDQPLPT